MITIPSLSDVTDILDTDLVMVTNSQGQSYKIAGSEINKRGKIIIANGTTITGAPLKEGGSVRVYFTVDLTAANASTVLQLNYNGVNYYVKAPKDGTLINFVATNLGGSPAVYKYLQKYTTLELLFDGTQFVIIGNPVILSSADYTIYADGSKKYNEPYFQPNYFKYDEKIVNNNGNNSFIKICSGTELRNLTYIELEASRVNTTGCWQRLYFTTYLDRTFYQLVKFYNEKYANGNLTSENEANYIFVMDNNDIYVKISTYSSGRVRLYSSTGTKINGEESSSSPSGTKKIDGYSAIPIIQ